MSKRNGEQREMIEAIEKLMVWRNSIQLWALTELEPDTQTKAYQEADKAIAELSFYNPPTSKH